jgi:hypothetical protein
MRNCIDCGKKLGFFERGIRCKKCETAYKIAQEKIRLEELKKQELLAQERRNRLAEVETYLKTNYDLTEDQTQFLKTWDKKTLADLYIRIYGIFEQDHELNEKEIMALKKLQEVCSLSNEEIGFDDRVLPYYYNFMIKEKKSSPKIHLDIEGGSPVVLKQGEIVHFADRQGTILEETRMVNLGYSGGSQGVSVPVPGLKGVRFRVGSYRGKIMKRESLVETSRGHLLITNERLFLHPVPGHKPVSIPLNKILSYNAYNNGLEVYKEGREKSYFFALAKSNAVQIIELCLGFLLGQRE